MKLAVEKDEVQIRADDGRLAGRYVFEDPYKPYLHPLMTPSGVVVSTFMPHDHKHHRALMYALRTPELNFWEERSTEGGEGVGRQQHVELTDVVEAGETVGFTQALEWRPLEGGAPVLSERRRITCTLQGGTFSWLWSTTLEAKEDAVLRMSQWSSPRKDGALINYHGLGIRLPREFSGEIAKVRIKLDGEPIEVAAAHGQVPQSIEFVGAADGYWPVRFGGVRISQSQSNTLFIIKEPFAYMALGPSNDAPRQLRRGEVLTEDYAVDVFDAEPPEA